MSDPLDDLPDSECGCAAKVPHLESDDFWVCPKCDAVWYAEEDESQ